MQGGFAFEWFEECSALGLFVESIFSDLWLILVLPIRVNRFRGPNEVKKYLTLIGGQYLTRDLSWGYIRDAGNRVKVYAC